MKFIETRKSDNRLTSSDFEYPPVRSSLSKVGLLSHPAKVNEITTGRDAFIDLENSKHDDFDIPSDGSTINDSCPCDAQYNFEWPFESEMPNSVDGFSPNEEAKSFDFEYLLDF
jgi:hypothetical protein